MDQVVTWVRDHPLETTLVLALAYVIAAGFLAARLTHPALVRAARGSARRAVLVMICFHAALLLGWGLAHLAANAVESRTTSPVSTLWATLPAIALLAPWSVHMLPRPARVPVDDYVDVGASRPVGRALAITAAPFAVAEFLIAFVAIVRALG